MKKVIVMMLTFALLPFAWGQEKAASSKPRQGAEMRVKKQREPRLRMIQNDRQTPPDRACTDTSRREMRQLVKQAREGSVEAKAQLKLKVAERFDEGLKQADARIKENQKMTERQIKALDKRRAERDQCIEKILNRMLDENKDDRPLHMRRDENGPRRTLSHDEDHSDMAPLCDERPHDRQNSERRPQRREQQRGKK